MVLQRDGSVWCCGLNSYGQLGTGLTRYGSSSYIQVIASSAIAISAGNFHSMVLTKDGSVWLTGRNEHGQLGDPSRNDRNSFVQVFVFIVTVLSHS